MGGDDKGSVTQSQASPIRKTSFVSQKFIELSPARKSSVTNSTTVPTEFPTSSLERFSKSDLGSPELIDRVTFATEALKLRDTEENMEDTEYPAKGNNSTENEGRISPEKETHNTRSF